MISVTKSVCKKSSHCSCREGSLTVEQQQHNGGVLK